MSIFTKAFWLATLERAIKTFAQTLGGTLTTAAVASQINSDISIPWQYSVLAAGLAALISICTSVGTHQVTKMGPGVGTAETLSPPAPAIPVE
jgi:Putative lactococcus lactis phage r1t holin